MVKITKCPPGEAEGARDLQEWGSRRLVGRSGVSPSKELFDLEAEVVGETAKAWRLFDGTVKAWVPKSQVENNGDGTFTMPAWLAEDKGFI